MDSSKYIKKKPNRKYHYGPIVEYTYPADAKNYTGRFKKEWVSLAQINIELGLDCGNIHKACRGLYHHAYGSVWRYKEDCLDVDGNVLQEIQITRAYRILNEKYRAIGEIIFKKKFNVKLKENKPERKIKSNIVDEEISQYKKSKPSI